MLLLSLLIIPLVDALIISTTMLGVACNCGGPDKHTAVTTAEPAVHYCSLCFAICCNGCYAG